MKKASGHWIIQRVTAIALVPLVLLLLYGVLAMAGQPYDVVHAQLASPFMAIGLALLIIAGFWHARLGMQEVIVDYIHKERSRALLLLLTNALAFGAGIAALFSLFRIFTAG